MYFIARSRTAPLRNHLYSKQVDLIVEVLRVVGRIRIYSTIIVAPEVDEHHARALDDLRDKVSELSQLVDSAAALFPTDLYVEINQISSVAADFLINFDTGHDTTALLDDITGRATKMALLARIYLGVDELSEESFSLFGKHKHVTNIAAVNAQDILRAVRKS